MFYMYFWSWNLIFSITQCFMRRVHWILLLRYFWLRAVSSTCVFAEFQIRLNSLFLCFSLWLVYFLIFCIFEIFFTVIYSNIHALATCSRLRPLSTLNHVCLRFHTWLFGVFVALVAFSNLLNLFQKVLVFKWSVFEFISNRHS